MIEKIKVPDLGESITEATVAKWLKNKGDSVLTDEPIVELETEKVNLEVPSPVDGTLTDISANNGQVVAVGELLGSVTESEKKEKIINKVPLNNNNIKGDKENITKFFNNDSNKIEKVKDTNFKKNSEEPLVLNKEIIVKNEKDKILSPSVRKIVAEKEINIEKITGTGKDGRVLKGDVLDFMGVSPKPFERRIKYGQEERIKMTRLRMTIAKRLKQAQENAAMLTTFNEVDMSAIIEIRKNNQEDFHNRFGIKLGFMSFFVKACVLGLKNFPAINAEIDEQDIVYKNYYNISFAVGTDKGLVVPVIKNADELSFADIEKNIKNLSEKARRSKLTIEDLQGGTFTISNGGVYGSMLSTPILNPPQSGVLGMHNIIERPIAINNEIKIKSMMYLALSYDHRIIDGKDSVSFLKLVKENLEDPRRLFLDL